MQNHNATSRRIAWPAKLTLFSRRTIMAGLATAALLPKRSLAKAKYPNRAIRVFVPFGPGGLSDLTMRIVGEKLGDLIGQHVIVVNQPGPGGITAARSVIAAPPDGYTLALLSAANGVSAAFLKDPQFNPVTDFVPISGLGFSSFVFLTAADSNYKSLNDVVSAAKANPGKLNFGTIAVGSSQNMTAVLFKALYGLDFAIVPFRSSPDVITATLRKDVDVIVDVYAAARSFLTSGQLRALATSGAKRSLAQSDVPTVQEIGHFDFDVLSWNGLFAPANTPAEITAFLNEKTKIALADPDVKRRLAELDIDARGTTPDEILGRLKLDIAKWNDVIDRAGIARQ